MLTGEIRNKVDKIWSADASERQSLWIQQGNIEKIVAGALYNYDPGEPLSDANLTQK